MKCQVFLFTLFMVVSIQLSNAELKDPVCVTEPTPNFSAPGRRISEQKCREYYFERKLMDKCSSSIKDLGNTEYPYMGALGYKKIVQSKDTDYHFLCAGFLISPKFALTAAQCVVIIPSNYAPAEILRFGNKNIKKTDVPRVDAKILSRIPHPNYQHPKKYFGIALLELESNLRWSKSIQPACLWTQDDVSTGRLEVPSWGVNHTEVVQNESSGVLRVMTVEPIDSATCQSVLSHYVNRNFPKVQDHHLCANESASEILLCSGSAGAPIISKVGLDNEPEDQMPYAMAITSYGVMCGIRPSVGVYTRVSSFVDWIEQTVWPQ